MEQAGVTESTINECVAEGRKKFGSHLVSEDTAELENITRKLSYERNITVTYEEVQFLLRLANKYTHAVKQLETKCDELICEHIKALFRIDTCNVRNPGQNVDSVRFPK